MVGPTTSETAECTLPPNEAGSVDVTAYVDGFGNAAILDSVTFTYKISLTSISPVEGKTFYIRNDNHSIIRRRFTEHYIYVLRTSNVLRFSYNAEAFT